MTTSRTLRVFLCHSSNDKPAVRELYQKLRTEPWIQPWLDEEELYPGQDWNMEIEKAVETADAIIVCLSKGSTTKEGYVQKEIKTALDYADYKPEGTLFIIPVRLDECAPPRRLERWQYEDYFGEKRGRAFQRLLVSLKKRAESLELNVGNFSNKLILSNGMEFMHVPAGEFWMGSDDHEYDEQPKHIVDIPYSYWMARFPITNILFRDYLNTNDVEYPEVDLEEMPNHPVVYINWDTAMKYCKWLNKLVEGEFPLGLTLRLPTEAEWEKTARGIHGYEWAWGNEFNKKNCNTYEAWIRATTNVNLYSPHGDSFYGCADMIGNAFEWTHSLFEPYPYSINDGRENEETLDDRRVLRGGSYNIDSTIARCGYRSVFLKHEFQDYVGFRIILAPPLPK